MTDNFVDVVGYQFERVHTGVIAWLLDTESGSSPLSATERAEIITAIAPGLVDAGKKLKVTATPEYAPRGRKVRIDLHLKITEGASEAHILIECKTDAEVKTEQLERIGEAFRSALPETRFTLVVLAIGAGQFTLKHQLERLKAQEYQVIDLERALEIFSRRVSAEAHWIYKDWIAAMKEERDRGAGIEQAMREAGGIDNLPLGNGGYRRGFSAYYLYYDRLRTHLEKALGAEWASYSGVHNPAMGWNERPADAGLRMAGIKLYWEFNGRDLCQIGKASCRERV